MDLYLLRVLATVAEEGNFSRAGERLGRTQPAVSLAVQRLEAELGEKLIDRSAREARLTEAGALVVERARRLHHQVDDLKNALVELRDVEAGRLAIGANESTSLYLLKHICRYRRTHPRVTIQVRRCLSSRIPRQIVDGDLELGVISFDPEDARLESSVVYTDHLCFVVSPEHRLARRRRISIDELAEESFVAHNVQSPYRNLVIRRFRQHRVPLRMGIEMPTVETIRRMVLLNEGVGFLPNLCVERELATGALCEVKVDELQMDRKIRLVRPRKRALSHAARAFLRLVVAGEKGAGVSPALAGAAAP